MNGVLLFITIMAVVTCVWLSTWYGSVHWRYDRKFRHQQEQLEKAARTNRKVITERDACLMYIKEVEKDRDEWKHTARVYWEKWKRGGGGETITKTVTVNPFTREELTILVQLCHPDKHGGKASATAMTQRLNKLRATTK